jgi:hypothetical protein
VALLTRAALLALVAAACFDPVELDGKLRCDDRGECPPGFACAGDLCWRPGGGPPDAAPEDAGPPDAALPACSNGIDDDCDGKIDRTGGDPGCSSGTDDDERGTRECDDGLDNDTDGFADFRSPECGGGGDPECDRPDDDDED